MSAQGPEGPVRDGVAPDDLVPDGRGNQRQPSPDCPVEVALAAISGKWTTLVLRELSRADLTYGELKSALPTVSDKILADRLHALTGRGLVERRVRRGFPNRTRYLLTDAGRAVRPLLVQLHATGTELQRLTR
ncbi:Transcriptional regulator, HxlR family OS=Tsukamurella paurometabola (strain ATCC 8368 / DSM/ CCUG 35730 / CIP 100753 / JCM 10117 / KCTC 9821 / NBRC 16120/ NCIMB 702349 / NCTC 13040) OX=521096 GN=Tpau_3750 PE=4 SV=1 [Tsukamurella paurometabola]|nr:Uncharacterized HTH-type transcriptional regulator yybR [Tsukamurella paurometabola]